MMLNLKNIQWTKKRIVLLIVTAVVTLSLIAGGIFAAIYFNQDTSSPGKKRVIKKQIITIVEDEENNSSYENNNGNETEKADSVIVNILKKIKRIFDSEEEKAEITYNNISLPVKTLHLRNYGAKGNGTDDDGAAIFEAVMDLQNCGPGSKLIFEKDKTYYVKSLKLSSALTLSNVQGLEIDGQNSTILMGSLNQYLTASKTKDCKVTNLRFDYATKPAFLAECISIDAANGFAVMKADRNIGIEDGKTYTPSVNGYFGVLNNPDSRYHMYVSKYQMISNADRTFRVYFDMSDSNTKTWFSNGHLQKYGMISPMPVYAHTGERGFTITYNYNFTMEHIKINACSRFGMYIGQNEGKLTFTDVDFVPADNDLDRDMNFTSWRDAFHVKDNRCPIYWTDCESTGNYDDVFNISSSTLYVSDYNVAKNRISLVWAENNNGKYYDILPGDTINFIDTETGEDCGTATVKRVVSQNKTNVIITEEPVDGLLNTGTSIYAFFTNRCSPNSVIENCYFNGTNRFRGPITFKNTKFYNQRMWIDIYGSLEGPVPEGIHFINCTIESGSGASIIIGANSGNTENNAYHVRDILFKDCKLDSKSLSIYSSDEKYVSIKNCTEHDGTPIADRN